MKLFWIVLVFSSLAGLSCKGGGTEPAGKDGWLVGNAQEKFEIVAGQLRGFDMAMVETGYRYQELYWAGIDANWEHAEYQIGKIRKAVNSGLERRPKRASSAQSFLNEAVPDMNLAIASKDATAFQESFVRFTESCNACHAMEKLPFFVVDTPTSRPSPIRKAVVP